MSGGRIPARLVNRSFDFFFFFFGHLKCWSSSLRCSEQAAGDSLDRGGLQFSSLFSIVDPHVTKKQVWVLGKEKSDVRTFPRDQKRTWRSYRRTSPKRYLPSPGICLGCSFIRSWGNVAADEEVKVSSGAWLWPFNKQTWWGHSLSADNKTDWGLVFRDLLWWWDKSAPLGCSYGLCAVRWWDRNFFLEFGSVFLPSRPPESWKSKRTEVETVLRLFRYNINDFSAFIVEEASFSFNRELTIVLRFMMVVSVEFRFFF